MKKEKSRITEIYNHRAGEDNSILVKGARQNNLKGFTLKLPLNKLMVITGVSGSGKSSLAFDTIYSEGQRRYVETFSPYTRQFMDRMDRPRVERIEGIPPAIAIDQTNPVRTSRSTVGTMTELNDHLKLLFARAATLYCRGCGKRVQRDTPDSVWQKLLSVFALREHKQAQKILITFPVKLPPGFSEEEAKRMLALQGYRRILKKEGNFLEVIQDRVDLVLKKRSRVIEDLEAAFKYGQGRAAVYPLDSTLQPLQPYRYSTDLHCPDCNLHYRDPVPNLFSFNSPLGACDTCRGFGRIIDIDYDLVVPDKTLSLGQGAVRPWQSKSYRECQQDLIRFARRRDIPIHIPWNELSQEQKKWVLEGEGEWDEGRWYGVKRFFRWLETKSYKMHIRVLLSKYRAFRICPDCKGARLKPEALLWRLGEKTFPQAGDNQPGANIHQVMLLPIQRCFRFFQDLELPRPLDEATDILLQEIRSRLKYLVDIGLGYLALDRQSRTLSGGEVQRINLTTALGTSLVNTLFVLDEPSIGLHPRDMGRLIMVLHRLRDSGNTIIVVEHDPQVIKAADLIIDMGPGPGEQGGHVVFQGEYQQLLQCSHSLTAQYLNGSKKVAEKPDRGMHSPDPSGKYLEILEAEEHNLNHLDVRIPLNRLVCITGVSGSGKSTLVEYICYRGLLRLKHKPVEAPGRHRAIHGSEQIDDVVMVDQSPIGKTTRSNPASYVGALDGIRKLFSEEPLAKQRGYTPGSFSFNSTRGQCPSCKGSGFEHIEMQFLSDVYLRCPECSGKRYRAEVLEVKMLPQGGKADTASEDTEGKNLPGPGEENPGDAGDTYTSPGDSSEEHSGQNHTSARPKSIAEVLDMTVTEACTFFSGAPQVQRMLEPLKAVGLGYLTLGQPVPTLSGGEAQRLKLAGHLSRTSAKTGKKHTLFLFDEPTTGLHFDDISKLLSAFRRLLDAGHSVVIIEHNLDVISASDWIIDLGPEGGEQGGEVVCTGRPEEITSCPRSHTAEALKTYLNQVQKGYSLAPLTPREGERENAVAEKSPAFTGGVRPDHAILIRHAREHNLKNIDVRIPHQMFTVVTGISGSGKSTVAFDILFSEGQRRYLESLNAYARQIVQPVSRPDLDGISGLPPTVAIEQRTSRGGYKSTVATMTEIYHFLRLLFAKLGVQYCPQCQAPIQPQSVQEIAAKILRDYRGKQVELLAPLVTARKGYYTDLAKWAANRSFDYLRVDGKLLPTRTWPRLDRFKEHNIELPVGRVWIEPAGGGLLRQKLHLALEIGKGMVYVSETSPPGHNQTATFSTLRTCPRCGRSFEELDPRLFSFNSRLGWCPGCSGTGLRWNPSKEKEWTDTGSAGDWEDPHNICPECGGRRLNRKALSVRFRYLSIAEITGMPVDQAEEYFHTLELEGYEQQIARDILSEIASRLEVLMQVGLSYLTLERAAPTLSGGESQRVRLASQLGLNLRGVCYILDEPTIGLHARDHARLLKTLHRLKTKGNTVVVVEHDEHTIRQAEHVVDLGPGGGVNGGSLVYQGPVTGLLENSRSATGKFLRDPLSHPIVRTRRSFTKTQEPGLEVAGADLHNLKDLDLTIPLGRFICVTGVSGSGKSTLVREVIYQNLRRLISRKRKHRSGKPRVQLRGCNQLNGWKSIRRVMEVDQTPIGKTPRSCPATYVGFWDRVRRLYASLPEAKIRGYAPGRFSFNVSGGRCEACGGQGIKKIGMSFLPDVKVVCEMCGGARYNPETLAVKFKAKSIADILSMSVDEAAGFFSSQPGIYRPLKLLRDVGLGYLALGQHSPTLSGGEAQRLKLVTELAKTRVDDQAMLEKAAGQKKKDHCLYVMDEPTIGLHMGDAEKLIKVLHRLVDTGNTVIIIEHNLDIIAEADWIIDLGPEGGDRGGMVTAQGPPEAVAESTNGSYTAAYLADFLKSRQTKE
ncbi:MAG: excinuclease ABC subunit UvrA [Spirochaetota bacterium]